MPRYLTHTTVYDSLDEYYFYNPKEVNMQKEQTKPVDVLNRLISIRTLYRQWSVFPKAEEEMTALINALTKELDSVKVDSVAVNVIKTAMTRSEYE